MSLKPTERFSNRVADYIKWRPSYPPDVITILSERCGLTPDWVVADVGSGPGNLTRLFLTNGNTVIGVEPNREMREAGEELLAEFEQFTSAEGAAEATGLPDASVDLVVAGQAFHWFQPDAARVEFRRILRGRKPVALIWNERRLTGSPFLEGYEALLHRHSTDYAQVQHRSGHDEAALERFFGSTAYRIDDVPYAQHFDLEGIRGRLLSSSYAPAEGEPSHDAMMAELAQLFRETHREGVVAFEYDTRIFTGWLD